MCRKRDVSSLVGALGLFYEKEEGACCGRRGRAAGAAGRSAAGKWCRARASAAYSAIVSACLLNEGTALQFLMSPTT